MFDYVVTGITETDIFNVYTGLTPFVVNYYGAYPAGTTYITLNDVPFGQKMYVVIENDVTKYRTIRLIKTTSAYCSDICYGAFTIVPIIPPTPTASVTPSVTPTKSLTPSISFSPTPTPTKPFALSATPTLTPTISLSPTKSLTPTPTPSASSVINCGYYQVTYGIDVVPPETFALVTYTDCNDFTSVIFIEQFTSKYLCIQEIEGIPQIYFQYGYDQYVTINRISFCNT
jgi:hypothetical protein